MLLQYHEAAHLLEYRSAWRPLYRPLVSPFPFRARSPAQMDRSPKLILQHLQNVKRTVGHADVYPAGHCVALVCSHNRQTALSIQ